MEYLYRIDTLRMLKVIQQEGFRCGDFSRITQFGLKSECEQAREEGLKVPTPDLIGKPTVYFFADFNDALNTLDTMHYDFVTRYSKSIHPLSNDDLIFPDGAWGKSAVYAVFKNLQVNDIAFKPEDIEILVKNKWRSLKKFDFDSLNYIKCRGCYEHIPKKLLRKKSYQGEYRGDRFYCEPCTCLPIAKRFSKHKLAKTGFGGWMQKIKGNLLKVPHSF